MKITSNKISTILFILTADLQIVDTAFDKPQFNNLPPGVVNAVVGKVPEGETAWIIGIRTEIKF